MEFQDSESHHRAKSHHDPRCKNKMGNNAKCSCYKRESSLGSYQNSLLKYLNEESPVNMKSTTHDTYRDFSTLEDKNTLLSQPAGKATSNDSFLENLKYEASLTNTRRQSDIQRYRATPTIVKRNLDSSLKEILAYDCRTEKQKVDQTESQPKKETLINSIPSINPPNHDDIPIDSLKKFTLAKSKWKPIQRQDISLCDQDLNDKLDRTSKVCYSLFQESQQNHQRGSSSISSIEERPNDSLEGINPVIEIKSKDHSPKSSKIVQSLSDNHFESSIFLKNGADKIPISFSIKKQNDESKDIEKKHESNILSGSKDNINVQPHHQSNTILSTNDRPNSRQAFEFPSSYFSQQAHSTKDRAQPSEIVRRIHKNSKTETCISYGGLSSRTQSNRQPIAHLKQKSYEEAFKNKKQLLNINAPNSCRSNKSPRESKNSSQITQNIKSPSNSTAKEFSNAGSSLKGTTLVLKDKEISNSAKILRKNDIQDIIQKKSETPRTNTTSKSILGNRRSCDLGKAVSARSPSPTSSLEKEASKHIQAISYLIQKDKPFNPHNTESKLTRKTVHNNSLKKKDNGPKSSDVDERQTAKKYEKTESKITANQAPIKFEINKGVDKGKVSSKTDRPHSYNDVSSLNHIEKSVNLDFSFEEKSDEHPESTEEITTASHSSLKSEQKILPDSLINQPSSFINIKQHLQSLGRGDFSFKPYFIDPEKNNNSLTNENIMLSPKFGQSQEASLLVSRVTSEKEKGIEDKSTLFQPKSHQPDQGTKMQEKRLSLESNNLVFETQSKYGGYK